MSNEFSEALDALGEKFGIVIDWTQQNIQPYVQDLMQRVVQYKLATSIFGTVCWRLILIVCIVLFARNFKKVKFDCLGYLEDGCGKYLITTIATGILILVSALIFPKMIDNIIQCVYIPEKIILKELQTIIK